MVLWQGAAASRFATALVEPVQLEREILTLSVMKISHNPLICQFKMLKNKDYMEHQSALCHLQSLHLK